MRSSPFIRGARLSTLLLALVLVACGQKPEAMLSSAKDFLAKNDAKAAVIQVKNALQVNPDLPEARYLLGKALFESGDAVGAETELRKALALKVPQDQVLPLLAASLLAQGKAQKVTEEFAQTTLQGAAQADLQTTLATAYAAQGQADKSNTALAEALKADNSFAPALLLQARNKAGKDVDGALADLDGILAKSAQNYQAWKLKGDLLLYAKNKPDEALEAYRKSVAIRPDFIAGHMAAVRLLFEQSKLDEVEKQLAGLKAVAPNHPITKTLDAQLAFQRKDFKAARALAQQALKVAPTYPPALQVAGATELQLNSVLQAESFLAKAVQLAPEMVTARRLLAATYARSANLPKALSTLEPALSAATVDPETLSLAGELYLQSGNAKKAEEFFVKASKQDPQNTRRLTALAVTRVAEGKDSGLAELQQIADSDKSTVADMALISTLLGRQQYDKALKAIDALEKKQPGKVGTAVLRGKVYMAMKDTANARKSFEKAASLDPTAFTPVAALAGLDLAEKKPQDAKKRFEALLEKDPKNGRALLALAELAANAGGSKDEVSGLITKAVAANPTDVPPRLLLIEFYLRNKDTKQAVTAAQDAQTALPDSPELLEALGRAQQANGDLNQAISSYNKLAAMTPQSPQPYMRLADAYMAAKDKTAAAQSLRKALEIKPDLKSAQTGSIVLDMDAKNYQGAVAMARTMQSQAPADAAGYVLEGDINSNQKNWDAAASAYRNGLKQSSASTELAIKLHNVLLVSGKNADADKFSATWVKDHPQDAAFQMYLADGAIARKEYPQGERMYLALLKQQPNNAMVYNNLAWLTARMHKDGAIAYAEKAVSLAPNQPAFMDTLAGLLAEKGDLDKALDIQKKAVEMSRSAPIFVLNLAKIQLKAGKKAEAKALLEGLAKLGDKFPKQSEVAELLKN